jgi:hypothetical protein
MGHRNVSHCSTRWRKADAEFYRITHRSWKELAMSEDLYGRAESLLMEGGVGTPYDGKRYYRGCLAFCDAALPVAHIELRGLLGETSRTAMRLLIDGDKAIVDSWKTTSDWPVSMSARVDKHRIGDELPAIAKSRIAVAVAHRKARLAAIAQEAEHSVTNKTSWPVSVSASTKQDVTDLSKAIEEIGTDHAPWPRLTLNGQKAIEDFRESFGAIHLDDIESTEYVPTTRKLRRFLLVAYTRQPDWTPVMRTVSADTETLAWWGDHRHQAGVAMTICTENMPVTSDDGVVADALMRALSAAFPEEYFVMEIAPQ